MDYWLNDGRWRNPARTAENDTKTGLPLDYAPRVLQQSGRFAVRMKPERRRWQVEWHAVTPEAREAYNSQVRAMRRAPEAVMMAAANAVLPEKAEAGKEAVDKRGHIGVARAQGGYVEGKTAGGQRGIGQRNQEKRPPR